MECCSLIRYRRSVMWADETHWGGRTVLVTGAGGLLGWHTCVLLLQCGAVVHGSWRHRPPPPGVHAHRASLPQDASSLLDAIRPAVVINLASPISMSTDAGQYTSLRAGILDATAAVAQACQQHGARLLHVGTCAEYGDHTAPFHEDMPPRPTSPYAALKSAATQWVLSLSRTGALVAGVVRPFRVIGPRDQSSVVWAAMQAVRRGETMRLTDGEQVREWNDATAMAHGLLAAAAHPNAVGQVLNLGGGARLSVRSIVEHAVQIANGDLHQMRFGAIPRRPKEVALFCGDHRRAEALWGPLPHPPIEQTLHHAFQWMCHAPAH